MADICAAQQGFFTAAQAVQAGYVDAVHGYHLANGDWERCCRGVYRLLAHPPSDWPELVIWSLWSRDRAGHPQGVYSHETADMIHGKIPRAPGPLHMTVPKSFRKNCEIPNQLILHKEDLDAGQIETREGFALTRAAGSRRLGGSNYDHVITAGED